MSASRSILRPTAGAIKYGTRIEAQPAGSPDEVNRADLRLASSTAWLAFEILPRNVGSHQWHVITNGGALRFDR